MANAKNKSDAVVEMNKEDDENVSNQTMTDLVLSVEKKKRNKKTINESISKNNHNSLSVVGETDNEVVVQTPRRSARKSVKPVQDYEEIVCTRTLRSTAKKLNDENIIHEVEEPAQRWTPAKVGRVSQKRGKRSRKVSKFVIDDEHQANGKGSIIDGDAKTSNVLVTLNDKSINNFDCQSPMQTFETLTEMCGVKPLPVEPVEKENVNEIKSSKHDHTLGNGAGSESLLTGQANKINGEEQILERGSGLQILTLSNGSEGEIESIADSKRNKMDSKQTVDIESIPTNITFNNTFELQGEIKSLDDSKTNKTRNEEQTVQSARTALDNSFELHGEIEVIGDLEGNKTKAEEKEVESTKIIFNNTFELQGDIKPIDDSETNKTKDEEQTVQSTKTALDNTFDLQGDIKPIDDSETNKTKDEEQTVQSTKTALDNTFDLQGEIEAIDEKKVIESSKNTLNITFEALEIPEKNKELDLNSINNDVHTVRSECNSPQQTLNETFELETKGAPLSEVDDLGVAPLPLENPEGSDDMPSLIFIDDDTDESGLSIEENIDLAAENDSISMNDKENNQLLGASVKFTKIDTINNGKNSEKESEKKQKNQVVLLTPKAINKNRSKIIRVPTPYKAHSARKARTQEVKSAQDEEDSTLEPLGTAGSARRRSSSTSRLIVNRKRKAPGISVSFYSPANQTAVIEEFDMMIAKRNKNDLEKSEEPDKDSNSNGNPKSKLKLGVTPTKANLTPSKISVRTKLPNFAAIHQKQFDKMENIVDHVVRKMERAKNLTSSTSKVASGKKEPTHKTASNESSKPKAKPKAAKNISSELSQYSHLREEELHKMETLPRPVVPSGSTAITPNKAKPKPKLGPKIASLHLVKKDAAEKTTRPAQQQPTKSQLSERNEPAEKKTSARTKKPVSNWQPPTEAKASTKLFDATIPGVKSTNSIDPSAKLTARRERHMGMFKGRVDANRSANNVTRQNTDFIRGVRLNRRFDLQMQHRQNLNN